MAEEPTLPPLPAVSWDSQLGGFRNTRKRLRRKESAAPSLISTSSDPAMFSSDDDPALDNYVQGRRKKRYIGSWFQQHPAPSESSLCEESRHVPRPKKKRAFQRQLDSGVWMGSDTSEDSVDLEPPAPCRLPQLKPAPQQLRISKAEEEARRRILACVEDGIEDVDLSGIGLEALSGATVASLSEFSCIPLVAEGVPFQHEDPALKLYLSSNSLGRVPGALFDLEYLTVLSLRGNRLTELPSSVAKLRNLETLNLSQNSLHYLPAELLDLVSTNSRLKYLQIHPNPFYQPEKLQQVLGEREGDLGLEEASDIPAIPSRNGHISRIVARSPVQYNDSVGMTCSKFQLRPLLPESNIIQTDDMLAESALPPSFAGPSSKLAMPGHTQEATKVPSLVELALQSCSRSAHLTQLPSLLPDGTPQHLFDLLHKTIIQRDSGGQTCSECRRRVIIPRTEWLEWREIYKLSTKRVESSVSQPQGEPLSKNVEERAVPFIYRGCSWKCLPRRELGPKTLAEVLKLELEREI